MVFTQFVPWTRTWAINVANIHGFRQWHMPGCRPSEQRHWRQEAAQVCKLGCQIALRCHVRWPPSLQIFCTLFAPSHEYLLGTPGPSLAAAVWCAERPAKIICNNIYSLWKYHVIIVTVDPRLRWLFLLILWLFWKIELWNFREK